MKHTFHSRQRCYERFGQEKIRDIRRKMARSDCIIEHRSNDVTISLVELNDKEAVVVAWSKKAIITVLTVKQYLENCQYKISDEKIKKRFLKYFPVERESGELKYSLGALLSGLQLFK